MGKLVTVGFLLVVASFLAAYFVIFNNISPLTYKSMGKTFLLDYSTEGSKFAHLVSSNCLPEKSSDDNWREQSFLTTRDKIFFCHVPKAASKTILRYLVKLQAQNDYTDDQIAAVDQQAVHDRKFSSPYFRRVLPNETVEFNKYWKFFFVRNPLDRLISAWRNKLIRKNSLFNKAFGKTIISQFRRNATLEEIERGYPVTLMEFFLYLANQKQPQLFNPHWRPAYFLCDPCAVSYDFIGRYESLPDDLESFANLATDHGTVPLMKFQHEEQAETLLPIVDHKYQQPPLKPEELNKTIETVLNHFHFEYKFFHYDIKLDIDEAFKTFTST